MHLKTETHNERMLNGCILFDSDSFVFAERRASLFTFATCITVLPLSTGICACVCAFSADLPSISRHLDIFLPLVVNAALDCISSHLYD